MDDVGSAIAEFYRATAAETVETPYWSWSPGSYQYVFRPTARTLRYLADRVGGPGLPRRLAAAGLRGGALVPGLVRAAPGVTRSTFPVAPDSAFDLAIVGYRIKLVRFDEGVVTTLPLGDGDLDDEIQLRRSLPAEIRVPPITSVDESVPYFTEPLVEGRELSDPVADWPAVLDALGQLESLYRKRSSQRCPIETALTNLDERLAALELADDDVVHDGRDALESLSLPSSITIGTVHGDFHTGNLLATDDAVYILDWERTCEEILIADFFKPFTSQYFDTGQPKTFVEMLRGDGTGASIAAEYADRLGPLAFGTDSFPNGLVVFHLLDRLSRKDSRRSARNSHQFALLADLLAEVRL